MAAHAAQHAVGTAMHPLQPWVNQFLALLSILSVTQFALQHHGINKCSFAPIQSQLWITL